MSGSKWVDPGYEDHARWRLRIVRSALEEVGMTIPSEQAVVSLYGPETMDEAEALADAIREHLGIRPDNPPAA